LHYGGAAGKTDEETDEDRGKAVGQGEAHDFGTPRAKGDADAEFTGALSD
jgi:hypothetical protein